MSKAQRVCLCGWVAPSVVSVSPGPAGATESIRDARQLMANMMTEVELSVHVTCPQCERPLLHRNVSLSEGEWV